MSLWTRSGHVAQLDRVREGPQLLQALVLDLPDALAGDVERPPDLVERSRMLAVEAVAGLAPELGAELALGPDDLVQLLDHVDGHANRARLVRQGPRDRLANPPRRVRRELEPFAVVELLSRANQADRPLLDQIEEG